MADTAQPKAWFKKALQDLKTAKFLLANTDSDLQESSAFHCQQCIEKSLKGFLAFKKAKISKIHDLRELAQAVMDTEEGLDFIVDNKLMLNKITDYAVAYRYPEAVNISPLTKNDIQRALAVAELIFIELSKRC